MKLWLPISFDDDPEIDALYERLYGPSLPKDTDLSTIYELLINLQPPEEKYHGSE